MNRDVKYVGIDAHSTSCVYARAHDRDADTHTVEERREVRCDETDFNIRLTPTRRLAGASGHAHRALRHSGSVDAEQTAAASINPSAEATRANLARKLLR